MTDALTAVRTSLAAQLAELRGVAPDRLPPALLDLFVRRLALPGGDVFVVQPRDWEQLRHEEGAAGRPVPYWAKLWPSGRELARVLAADPPAPGTAVLELGAGLALPSVVAGRAGARVLVTDGHTDAVAYAAHVLALNEADGEVAHVDWATHGEALAARGPFELVLAADVLYTFANVRAALDLLPSLVAPGGTVLLADPDRAGAAKLLDAAGGAFAVASARAGDVALHTLTRRDARP